MDYNLITRALDFDARNFLLEQLGQNNVGMEIGVHKGAFTRRILNKVHPRMLYLVDPWKFETDSRYKHSWYGGLMGGSQARMDRRYQQICQRYQHAIGQGAIRILRSYSSEAWGQLTRRSSRLGLYRRQPSLRVCA